MSSWVFFMVNVFLYIFWLISTVFFFCFFLQPQSRETVRFFCVQKTHAFKCSIVKLVTVNNCNYNCNNCSKEQERNILIVLQHITLLLIIPHQLLQCLFCVETTPCHLHTLGFPWNHLLKTIWWMQTLSVSPKQQSQVCTVTSANSNATAICGKLWSILWNLGC